MSTGGPGRDTAYDGQWNPRVGAYILPPLIGLPFNEMVKNGEGVRHANQPRYFTLIVVHAVFMALPFLFLIPAAIFSARFKKHENPRKAIQLHFILNTTSVVFLTIGFLAGWFAVNKGEWGGNPHHLIGVTVYGGVVLQGLFGVFLRAREKNKLRKLGQVGLKSMIHMWFGRGLWLLGLAQIPLGLYLYGSPMVLFIVYAALTFLIFVIYFIFEYITNRRTAKYQPAPGGTIGHRGGEPRASDGSSHTPHRRNQSHSGVSYSPMSESTRFPATTATPGTFETRTSYDGQEGTEFLSHESATGGFGNDNQHTNMPATPKLPRLNRFSQTLGRIGRIGGTPISFDASTRPPTGSTANPSGGGLYAPPNNRPQFQTLPTKQGKTLPSNALDIYHYRRNGQSDPLKDGRPGSQRVEMPAGGGQTTTTSVATTGSALSSPVSPASSGGVQMPRPQSEISSLSSDIPGAKYPGGHLLSPLLPPIKAPPNNQPQGNTGAIPMPPSPMGNDYLSDEGPASPPPQKKPYPPLLPSNPPRVPLPMPPEPNRRSNNSSNHRTSHDRVPSDTSTQPDAIIRIPLSGNSDTINIPAGELIRNNLPPGEHPQVSVQVKVDRVGRSVTVRRLPEDEAALERARRGRERQARAEERERRIGRDAAAASKRRSLVGPAGAGISEVSGGTVATTVSSGTLPRVLPPPSGASGSASKNVAVLPAPPSPHHTAYTDEEDEDYTSDEREYPTNNQQPAASAVGSRVSGNGGASVVSAAPTEDAEAEEKIRERRRRMRREERKEGGLTSKELEGGTYYGGRGAGGPGGAGGDGGAGVGGSGTGTGTGTGTGSLVRNMEWS